MMPSERTTSVGDLKLYTLNALLGEVTPKLRWVAVSVGHDSVAGRFVFEPPVSAEDEELVEDASTEVIAHYGGLTPVNFRVEYEPTGHRIKLRENEHLVFARKE